MYKKIFLMIFAGIFLFSLASFGSASLQSYYNAGADGDLVFTSGTKSYGNLVVNVDYTVSGNTLYLMLNRAYNFTNFELGSGMTLSTQNTTGAVLCIKANRTQIAGAVRLNNIMGTTASSFTCYGVAFSNPGIGGGGDGGNANAPSTVNGGSGSALGFGGGGAGGSANIYNATLSYVGYGGTGGAGGTPGGTGGASVTRSTQGAT